MGLNETISNWLVGHPISFALILFGLSSIISVYSTEIKDFVRVWPKQKWAEIDRRENIRQLRTLKSLHNNSYYLNLWFFWNLIDLFTTALWLNLAVWVALIAITQKPQIRCGAQWRVC